MVEGGEGQGIERKGERERERGGKSRWNCDSSDNCNVHETLASNHGSRHGDNQETPQHFESKYP